MAINIFVGDFYEKGKFKSGCFVWDKKYEDYKTFLLKKECLIFEKNFNKERLEIAVPDKQFLTNYIEKISEYINWLGGNFKNELMKTFEFLHNKDELLKDKWYEKLEILAVLLIVSENGKILAHISTGDIYNDSDTLDIEITEKEIIQVGYDLDPSLYHDEVSG